MEAAFCAPIVTGILMEVVDGAPSSAQGSMDIFSLGEVLIFVPDGKIEKARRYVPLSDPVRDFLRDHAKGTASKWVFPSSRKRGAHISYFTIAKGMMEVRNNLALPKDLVLYASRHTFTTDMLDKTANISLVKRMLGHESILTTERYLHPELKDVAQHVNERKRKNANENLQHSFGHNWDQIH